MHGTTRRPHRQQPPVSLPRLRLRQVRERWARPARAYGGSRMTMTTVSPDLGSLYENVRQRVVAIAARLGPDGLAVPVPACPSWTVRDLLGHLIGVAEDAVAGRLTGPPDEAGTAAQVSARRDTPLAALLDRWAVAGPAFAERVRAGRVWPAVIDAVSHEHDLRGAIGRPGERDSAGVQAVVPVLLRFTLPIPTVIQVGDDALRLGPEGEPLLTLRTDAFEALRWRMGRRSRRQMAAMCWTGDPSAVIEHLAVFGPAVDDIIE